MKNKLTTRLVLITMWLLATGFLAYAIYNGINNYYTNSVTQRAFLFAKQIDNIVSSQQPPVEEMDREQQIAFRTILRSLTADSAAIRDILIISPDLRIVFSDNPYLEGIPYKDSVQIEFLKTLEPRIVARKYDDGREITDVVWPRFDADQNFIGHIRVNINNDSIGDFYQIRRTVIFVAVFLVTFLMLLTYLVAIRLSPAADSVALPAVRKSGGDQADQPQLTDDIVHSAENGEFRSVFNRLNQLYEKTADLDKSFQQSEQQINSLLRVLNQGFLMLDLNMKIQSHNQFLLDVLYIRSTASAEKRIYEILQSNPRLVEMYRKVKDPLTHEVKQIFYLNLPNGRKINIEALARAVYDGDNIRSIIIYIKNLQLLNELAHTLQRSMKYGVISQLASSIGHEIRNPLSSLAIHTEIVESMAERSVSDPEKLAKIQKSINILNSEVERLNKLIDQFFNLAKSQDVDLTFENVNELMNEIIDLVQQQAFESHAVITSDFSSDLPLVQISRDQMKQVIINLILNSFDAMRDSGGGEVTLTTEFREGVVVISVKDNGAGIPEFARDNIFDLYFTTKDTGGGIGLAISDKIVEAHEGKLYFDTETDVGTTFFIELPTSKIA